MTIAPLASLPVPLLPAAAATADFFPFLDEELEEVLPAAFELPVPFPPPPPPPVFCAPQKVAAIQTEAPERPAAVPPPVAFTVQLVRPAPWPAAGPPAGRIEALFPKRVTDAAEPETLAFESPRPAGTAVPEMFQTIRPHVEASRPAAPPVPAEPAVPEPPAAPAPVVREVALALPEKVELLVAERAGEVTVAVRAPDPQVRQALQSDLGALAERLEQAGYRAEVSQPEARGSGAWTFEDGRRERREPAPDPRPQPRSGPGFTPEMRRLLDDFAR